MRGIVIFGTVLFAIACGNTSTNQPPDAAIDAAPPDALVDAPPPPTGTFRYVADKQRVPTNNNEARLFGLNLNGDVTVDNQFGMVLATLSGQGFDTQGDTTRAVDRGNLIILGELKATSTTTAATASFTLYTGTNPMPAACTGPTDTTCRHHLAGTATFEVPATSAHDTPLTGSIAANVLTAGPGHLQLPFLMFGTMPIVVNLIGARVRLSMTGDDRIGDSVIAGAIAQSEIDTKIYPGMQANISANVQRDCTMLTSPPNCGCVAGSIGKTMLSLFDTTPKDCAVTVAEIRNNALIQSLFAPDVTVEGMQALSFGVSVSAIHAAFVP